MIKYYISTKCASLKANSTRRSELQIKVSYWYVGI